MNGSEAAVQHALQTGENPELLRKVAACNRILTHNYRFIHQQWLRCDLPGCGRPYQVTIIPGQVLYPRWCESHRSEHRRRNFLRRMGLSHSAPKPEGTAAWNHLLETGEP